MNHQLWSNAAARVMAAAFLVATAAACGERISDVSSGTPAATPASPSAQVIGVKPAEPTGDPAGTTPVAGNTTEVTKHEETTQKPQEGDNHSYSTVAPNTPQKADGKNTIDSPERKAQ